MCGGTIEFIPCSHVGHIFRAGHPYNMTGRDGNKDVHGINSKRLAEVWMDDYKRLFYYHRLDLVVRTFGSFIFLLILYILLFLFNKISIKLNL